MMEETDHLKSRYVIAVSGHTLAFTTTRASHALPALYLTGIAAMLWLAAWNMQYQRHVWGPEVILYTIIALISGLALTQLRLLIFGETFTFDKDQGTVRRYGRTICRMQDIGAVKMIRISHKGEAYYIQLILHKRKMITIDYFPTFFGKKIDEESYRDATNAAKTIACFVGVSFIGK